MKYLIILISLMFFGCLGEDAKELQNSSFCLDGNKYIILDCYDTFDPDHCHVVSVNHPEMKAILNTDQIKTLLVQSAKECP